MKPNEQIYGNESDWQQQYFSQSASLDSPPPNKCPSFNSNNYSQLYFALENHRVTTDETIDKSISYCGLGTESDSSHVHSIVNENGTLKLKTVDRKVTNFFFWERTGTSYVSTTNGTLALSSTYSWYGNVDSGNMNAQISPICSINVKNQVLCIRVRCMATDKESVEDFTLESYMNNYTNYPYVIMVYAVSFNGYQIPRGSNLRHGSDSGNVEFGMGLLEPYANYNGDVNIICYAVEQRLNRTVFTREQNMFTLSGSLMYDRYARIANDNIPVFKAKDPENWTVEFHPNSQQYVFIYKIVNLQNINQFYEECLKQAACFGLYFSPSETVAISGSLTNQDMFIGILDTKGVGHGEYKRGENTAQAPQNSYNNMYEIQYDPNKNTDPNTYVKKTSLPGIISYAGRGEMAFIDPLQQYNMISDLVTEFKQLNYDVQTDGKVFLYQEPLANIKECRRIFLNTTAFTTPSNIQVGGITFQSRGVPIAIYNRYFDLGTYFIFPQHDDYRDFEPYTKLSLYIPYCGITDLPLAVFSNHYITIKLAVDFRFGNIKAIVFVDDMEFTSIDGDASIDLGFSALASAEFSVNRKEAVYAKQRNLSMGINSVLGNIAGTTISAVFHNPAGAVAQGLMGVANGLRTGMAQKYTTQLEIDKQHADLRQISATSSNIEVTNCLTPLLIFSRPVNLPNFNEDNYAKLKGRVCSVQDNISNFHGLTIANDAILDGLSCTETEKEMILQALEEGIILD